MWTLIVLFSVYRGASAVTAGPFSSLEDCRAAITKVEEAFEDFNTGVKAGCLLVPSVNASGELEGDSE